MPTHIEKEVMRVTIGPQIPTPASAVAPISGIFPMKILSTMLYNTLINCANIAGMARRTTNPAMLSVPRLFSLRIRLPPSLIFPIETDKT